jgi:hypothetical protein
MPAMGHVARRRHPTNSRPPARRHRSPAARRPLACTLAAAVLAVAAAALAQRTPALDVRLDGCVLPGGGCEPSTDVMTLRVADRDLSFAMSQLAVTRGNRSGGWVRDEMRLRPMRAHGPEEVLRSLRPGARVRMLATARLGERLLLVRSVEPLGEPSRAAGQGP